MLLVYQFDENDDPALLSQTLWRLKISHQIVMGKTHKELWLADPSHQAPTLQLIQIWQDNPEALTKVERNQAAKPVSRSMGWGRQLREAPATAIVILAALLVAFITQLGSELSTLRYFTISPFDIVGNQIRFYPLSEVLSRGEYWRLLSPAFLHFSVMHIVFNTLWVWDVGRRLEKMLGSLVWSFGVAIIAIVSNVVQFQFTGNPLFGGLSGVVYGIIGFAWLMPVIIPRWPTIVSKPLMIFFMVWLAIGYTQLPEMIGLGQIANTAHTIGLGAGLVLGIVYWFIIRVTSFKKM
ncbi:rhomboid family intramembrane serine protease [Marinomonas pollencensis]|uniref:GlpG protein n=1 Tax=Marinomonas pollencensis TaxID=491954 RepID=A0A3E0DQX7_9GAMM|nr:rhomboid family intramembrane serine protease [Marinomonas pollencensis]REG85501.1 GlpG protein [Marinomonas pollencensis]